MAAFREEGVDKPVQRSSIACRGRSNTGWGASLVTLVRHKLHALRRLPSQATFEEYNNAPLAAINGIWGSKSDPVANNFVAVTLIMQEATLAAL